MTEMGTHSRLTEAQAWLLSGFIVLGAALTPLSFLVMFLTVNKLLTPYMDGWAWVVPIGTEVGFTGFFIADLLLEARRRPAVWLHIAPYAFAAVSVWLNVAAARGNIIGMAGHVVLPMVFFGYLLAAKLLAKRLSVSDEDRKREVAVADAIAHARDILRAIDRWWRFRAPVLLRRQIRSRRLPAAVTEAIEQGIMFGGASKWEPVVETWVTGMLALPEGVSAQLAAAREAASRSAIRSASGDAPASDRGSVSANDVHGAPGSHSGDASRGDSANTSGGTPRRRRVVPAKATDEQLADLILAEINDPAELNPYRVNKVLKDQCNGRGVGEKRAADLVDLAQRRHRASRVVAIGERS